METKPSWNNLLLNFLPLSFKPRPYLISHMTKIEKKIKLKGHIDQKIKINAN